MTARCIRTVLCLSISAVGICFAQSASAVDNQKLLLQMTQRVLAAEVAEDQAALATFLTDNFTHTHEIGLVQSKAEFIATFAPGANHYKAGDLSEVSVRDFGASAVVSGKMRLVLGHERSKQPNADHHYSFTCFWVQEQGKWRMAAWVTSPVLKTEETPATAR